MGAATIADRSPSGAYLLSFIVLGVSLSTVGPALPQLREQADVGISAGGALVAAQGIGYITASLVTGRLLDHHGAGHRFLLSCATAAAAATTVLSFAGDLWTLSATFLAIGACCGGIDVSANTLLVWNEAPERLGTRLNALHLRFGIGAIAAPLLVAASLAVRGDLLLVSAALAAVVAATAVRLRRLTSPRPRIEALGRPATDDAADAARTDADEAGGADAGAIGMRAPGARRLVLAGAAFFVLYVGAEGGFGAWSTTYAEGIDLGVDISPALLTAVYWGGFTLGRIATVAGARTRSVDRILTVSCAAATVAGGVLVLVDALPAATWVMVGVLGFTLGPQYATMLAVVDRRIGLDGRVTSLLVGAAGIGGLAIPVATGWALDRTGVTTLPLITAAAVAGAWALAHAVVRGHAVRHRPPLPVP